MPEFLAPSTKSRTPEELSLILDMTFETLSKFSKDVMETLEDHETRIRVSEATRNSKAGEQKIIRAILMFIGTIIGGIAVAVFSHFWGR